MKARIFPLVLCLGVLACDKAPNPVAPAGTILTITAAPSQISLTGEASRVSVTGSLPSGNLIRPGTQISLATSLGVLRPLGSACNSTATVSIVEADDGGQAFANLCGDGRGGEATVTASLTNAGSGEGATGSATVKVQIGQTDASRPTLLISANPTTVRVGEASTITLIGRASDGSPVPSGQRIRLTVDLGSIDCARSFRCSGDPQSGPCDAVCTNSRGEAEATYTAGDRAGTGKITGILGTSAPASVDIAIRDAPARVILTATPQQVSASANPTTPILLSALVLNSQSTGVPNLTVVFEVDADIQGAFDQGGAVVVTNASGTATSRFTPNQASLTDELTRDRRFTITATASGEGTSAEDERVITVIP